MTDEPTTAPPRVLNDAQLKQIYKDTNPWQRLAYDADEAEFIANVGNYQKANGRAFPGLCEILGILKALGYVRDSRPVPPGEVKPHA